MGGTKADYGRLFLETIKLSASTFGGGFIIVPLMQRRFVRELGWIEEQEMLDLTAIAQSAPGAIAVNAAIIIGYHLAGIPGALVALLGTVLPPLVIISVISLFYNAFRSNPYVAMAMTAMLAGVAAVICDVVITMVSSIVHEKRVLPLIILIASFMSVFFFHVSVVAVILVCGAAGAASTLLSARRREPRP